MKEATKSTAGSTFNEDFHLWTMRKWKLQQVKLLEGEIAFGTSQSIFLTQDLGDEIMVTVSRFHPEPGDATGYMWEDPNGKKQMMEMPCYWIVDLEEALLNIQEYGRRSRSLYIESLLADANPIIRQTFQVALSYTAFAKASAQRKDEEG